MNKLDHPRKKNSTGDNVFNKNLFKWLELETVYVIEISERWFSIENKILHLKNNIEQFFDFFRPRVL